MAQESSTNVDGLTILGNRDTKHPTSPDEATLETFANASPDRDYNVVLDCPEFTSLPRPHRIDVSARGLVPSVEQHVHVVAVRVPH